MPLHSTMFVEVYSMGKNRKALERNRKIWNTVNWSIYISFEYLCKIISYQLVTFLEQHLTEHYII